MTTLVNTLLGIGGLIFFCIAMYYHLKNDYPKATFYIAWAIFNLILAKF